MLFDVIYYLWYFRALWYQINFPDLEESNNLFYNILNEIQQTMKKKRLN